MILIIGTSDAEAAGTSGFTFLTIGEGARPAGMGESFVAMADDVNSIYWNCAGLARVTRRELTSSFMQYVVDINTGYLGYVMPVKNGGIGIGVVYLDYGKIPESTIDDPTGSELGSFQPFDAAMIVSYGQKITRKLSLGASVKGAYEEIKGYSASAAAMDAGLLYDLPVRNLKLGLAVKNVGVQTKAFIEETNSLPMIVDLGLGYSLLDQSLKLGANVYKQLDLNMKYNLGMEYAWNNCFFARLGYQSKGDQLKTGSSKDSMTGFTTGLGINFQNFKLDYAFVPFNELGETHRISLGFVFGNSYAE